MKTVRPLISIIIPCRNETKYMKPCLDSIVSQTYPREKMEILVVDGMSEDKTRQIVETYSKNFNNIKLLDNSFKR
jgi:glycosyltransferase involved in cell wall biosynthesis